MSILRYSKETTRAGYYLRNKQLISLLIKVLINTLKGEYAKGYVRLQCLRQFLSCLDCSLKSRRNNPISWWNHEDPTESIDLLTHGRICQHNLQINLSVALDCFPLSCRVHTYLYICMSSVLYLVFFPSSRPLAWDESI